MKSIKVVMNKRGNILEQVYPSSNGYSFSLFSVVDKENRQFGGWHTCRETLANVLCSYHQSGPSDFLGGVLPGTRSTRILVASRIAKPAEGSDLYNKMLENMKSQMICSIKILHVFEKHLGWSLSKVSEVEDDKLRSSNIACYAFTSSIKWSRSTQLLSLYLLLVRLGRTPQAFDEFESVSDLRKAINKYGKLPSPKNDSINRDFSHLSGILKKLPEILDNVDRIFFRSTMKKNLTTNSSTNGILGLVGLFAKGDVLKNYKEVMLPKPETVKENASGK